MGVSTEINRKIFPNGEPKPLPKEVTMKDVIASMPKEVFHKDPVKAWRNVVITVVSCVLSHYLIMYSPWFLLPVAWAFASMAWTGFFVIGHDCGHLSFSSSHLINDIVGTLSFLPLFFPFEPWRIKHNHHHNNTNKLFEDNAWQPFQTDYYESAPELERTIMRLIKGPFWYLASVGHWVKEHFFLSTFTPDQHDRVKVSLAAVSVGAVLFFPYVLSNYGAWALIKYWFIPVFLGFHFWMSTFTMVHHTLPHIPFLPADKWSDVQARLTLTVHCEYPAIVELLCHQINVHIPHHVATSIPSYNLRMAHAALKKKWGPYLNEAIFGVDLIKEIISRCHLYDEQECYVPFAHSDLQHIQDPKKKKN